MGYLDMGMIIEKKVIFWALGLDKGGIVCYTLLSWKLDLWAFFNEPWTEQRDTCVDQGHPEATWVRFRGFSFCDFRSDYQDLQRKIAKYFKRLKGANIYE